MIVELFLAQICYELSGFLFSSISSTDSVNWADTLALRQAN